MRTAFSTQQLQDPGTRAMEQILRNCVHCGFCNATCPTYLLTGNELDGPRGRIYLIKDMLEEGSLPSGEVVMHLDRCLSCLSCKTTCPSGVDYMHLIDHARVYIEHHHKRRPWDKILRCLLASILPSPDRLQRLLKLGKLAQPFGKFLPAAIRTGLQLAEQINIDPLHRQLNPLYPAAGKARGRVGLLPGCAQQIVASEINSATIRLLNQLGFDVHVLTDTACCAAIEHHLGKAGRALNRIKENLHNWSTIMPELDALITNASGCGTMMKDYAWLLKDDTELSLIANQASMKTRDICEFITQHSGRIKYTRPGNVHKVAYQNPCSMQHAQGINSQPVRLLQVGGFHTVTLADAHLCCGSAGTYNFLQAAIARKLGEKKADAIESAQADVVASGNLGCILQLRQFARCPVVHTVQLLDWASGGPRPKALDSACS